MQANDGKNIVEESEIDKQFRKSELYQRMNDKINVLQAELQRFYHAKYMVDFDVLKHGLAMIRKKYSLHWYMESEFVHYDKEKNVIDLDVTKFE
jgi:hypothetical protein